MNDKVLAAILAVLAAIVVPLPPSAATVSPGGVPRLRIDLDAPLAVPRPFDPWPSSDSFPTRTTYAEAAMAEGLGGGFPFSSLARYEPRSPHSPRFVNEASAPGNKPYGVEFRCPTPRGQFDPEVIVVAVTCPQYVIDAEGDLMSNPDLVVDTFNADVQAFHALHGGVGIHQPPPLETPPPSSRARWNALHQPHTTFQTGDGGSSWADNRYAAPSALGGQSLASNDTVYGMDNVITLDKDAHLYLASLYAYRSGNEQDYHYTVSVWKSHRANRPVDYSENQVLLHHEDPTNVNVLDDLWIAYAPETNRVVVLWLEHAGKNGTNAAGKSSWIEAYWSDAADSSGAWTPISPDQQVGSCRRLARPMSYRTSVYLACLPGKEYTYDGVTGGSDTWQVHEIDTRDWTIHRVSNTGVKGTNGLFIDMAQSGHMLFMGSGITPEGTNLVQVTEGALARNWTKPDDISAKLLRAPAGVRLDEARVTAGAFTPETRYFHILYMEKYQRPTTADASQIQQSQARVFNKTYAVLRWAGDGAEWVGRFDDLNFGGLPAFQGMNGPGAAYRGLDDAVFDDLHDGLYPWHDPDTRKERLFTAFDDYGTIRFAEVIQVNALPALPIPPVNVPAIPIALAQSSASAHGATVLALSGLLLLRMLTAKHRHAIAAADR